MARTGGTVKETDEEKKTLYLIDAFALVFKAYYAMIRHPLKTKSGFNTSAIYGFFRSIIKIVKTYAPDYFIIVFDSPGKTFRHDIYPEYKANRQETPEDLLPQIEKIVHFVNVSRLPSLAKQGLEADDIIASLVRNYEEKLNIRIISSDKDLKQLIRENVIQLLLKNPGEEFQEYGKAEMKTDLGIKPEQMADYLALIGDSADNVPGVRGIGPKTAKRLLQVFGSLDNLYEKCSEVKNERAKQALLNNRESAFLSKKLVELNKNEPLAVNLEDFTLRKFQLEKIESALSALELKTIIRDLRDMISSINSEEEIFVPELEKKENVKIEKKYKAVKNLAELEKYLKALKQNRAFAFDVETTGFDPYQCRIIGLSFADQDNAFFVPVHLSDFQKAEAGIKNSDLSPEKTMAVLKEYLEDPGIKKIGQNIKFDIKVLKTHGIEVKNVFFDTMIASYCLEITRSNHGMDFLADLYLNYKTIHYRDVVGDKKDSSLQDVPYQNLVQYAAEDADITFKLYEVLKSKIDTDDCRDLFYEIEIPLVPILARMELDGILVNSEYLHELSYDFDQSLITLTQQIYELAGRSFNINSSKQLSAILFHDLQLEPVKKTKTGYSTDINVLQVLKEYHPLPAKLLEYRTIAKLKSTYTDSLPKLVNPVTKRIHTNFIQTGTHTGRFSSNNPNLQNIPVRDAVGKKIRQAFIPSEDWWFLSADYSQIELCLLAELSRDKVLLDSFQKGIDIHAKTASVIFDVPIEQVDSDMRRVAKTVNFGIIYGISDFGLARDLRISRKEAKIFIDKYFASYPDIKNYQENLKKHAAELGYVTTYWKRRRDIPEIRDKNNTRRQYGERLAVNTPIQGTAADLIKIAMTKIFQKIQEQNLKSRLLLQVHDELIFEVPETEKSVMGQLVKENMTQGYPFQIKLKVDLAWAKSWGDLD